MSRKTYVWDPETREFIEIEKRKTRVNLQVITDTMDQTWHPCDGRYYDSKSEFRKVTRAYGGIETGGESQAHVEKNRYQVDRNERKHDIARAIRKLRGRKD